MPAKQGKRVALLSWLATQILAPGESVDEKALGSRLSAYHDDVAMLRRYLIDFRLLTRTPDGTVYALPTVTPRP
jgi:hypothetical protein